MEFDPTITWGNVLTLIALATSLATAVYTWILARRSNVDTRFVGVSDRLTAGSKRMNTLELRIQKTEAQIAELPNKDEVHQLGLGIAGISGDIKGISATMDALLESQRRLTAQIERHEEHLRGGR